MTSVRVLVWNLETFGALYRKIEASKVQAMCVARLINNLNADVVVIQEFQANGAYVLERVCYYLQKITKVIWEFDWVKSAVSLSRLTGSLSNLVHETAVAQDLDMTCSSSHYEAYGVAFKRGMLDPVPEVVSAGHNQVHGRYLSPGARFDSYIALELGGRIVPDWKGVDPFLHLDEPEHLPRNGQIPMPYPQTAREYVAFKKRMWFPHEYPEDCREQDLHSLIFRFAASRRPCSVRLKLGAGAIPLVVYHAPVNPSENQFTPVVGTLLAMGSRALSTPGIVAGDFNVTEGPARGLLTSDAAQLGFNQLLEAGGRWPTTGVHWRTKGRPAHSQLNVGPNVYSKHSRDLAFKHANCKAEVAASVAPADWAFFDPRPKIPTGAFVDVATDSYAGELVLDHMISGKISTYDLAERAGAGAITEYIDDLMGHLRSKGKARLPAIPKGLGDTLRALLYNVYVSDHLPVLLEFQN